MKEDVLEQIVDDYLQFKGYFTVHNVSFKPPADDPEYDANKDRVPSDVDVVGYHPHKTGVDRVAVVSCKSWQVGFDADYRLNLLREGKKVGNRYAWQSFRELWIPKWSKGFRSAINELTGVNEFTYYIAVTELRGNAAAWATEPRIAENLPGCSVGFLPLQIIWATLLDQLKQRPAASEIGRLAQLLKAAGLTAPVVVAEPAGPAAGSDAAAAEEADSAV